MINLSPGTMLRVKEHCPEGAPLGVGDVVEFVAFTRSGTFLVVDSEGDEWEFSSTDSVEPVN